MSETLHKVYNYTNTILDGTLTLLILTVLFLLLLTRRYKVVPLQIKVNIMMLLLCYFFYDARNVLLIDENSGIYHSSQVARALDICGAVLL